MGLFQFNDLLHVVIVVHCIWSYRRVISSHSHSCTFDPGLENSTDHIPVLTDIRPQVPGTVLLILLLYSSIIRGVGAWNFDICVPRIFSRISLENMRARICDASSHASSHIICVLAYCFVVVGVFWLSVKVSVRRQSVR